MRKYFVLFAALVIWNCGRAQEQDTLIEYDGGGITGFPVSVLHPDIFTPSFRNSMESIELPALSNSTLIVAADSLADMCANCNVEFYGKAIIEDLDIKQNAQYHNNDIDDGQLWILKLNSSTAKGLHLFFGSFNLPPGAFLFAYNQERTRLYGPYTSAESPLDEENDLVFALPIMMDNTVFLEYYEPAQSVSVGEVMVRNPIHVFRELFGNDGQFNTYDAASCHTNVACQAGWEEPSKAVAIITKYDGVSGFAGWCSGTLLNNTNEDGEGYLLTAAHCADPSYSGSNPAEWQIYFDYQRGNCAGTLLTNFNKIVFGGTTVSSDVLTYNSSTNKYWPQESDYLLVRLSPTKEYLKAMNLCYAGWDMKNSISHISSSYQSFVVGHPRGAYKKIAKGDNLRNASSWYGYNSNNFFTFDYITGTTEGGSSGGGLFNPWKQLIGTVHGAARTAATIPIDPCDYSTFYSAFGKFSRHWTLGSFAQYLDPANLINSSNTSINAKCFLPAGTTPSYGGYVQPPPSAQVSYASITDGVRIDHVSGNPNVLCDDNQWKSIHITPKNASHFLLPGFEEETPCGFLGSNLDQGGCYIKKKVAGIPTKCACKYISYRVYLWELDVNNTLTGNNYSDLRKYQVSYLPYGFGNAYLPQPKATLHYDYHEGYYYRAGMEHPQGTYQYAECEFYLVPQTFSRNGVNILKNVYAHNNITLNNCQISCQKLQAGSSIQLTGTILNPGTTIVVGSVDCQILYRLKGPGKTETYQEAYIPPPLPEFEDELIDKSTSSYFFPNPTSGEVTLNYQNAGRVVVYNVLGNKVFELNGSQDGRLTLNLRHLASGAYFLKYFDEYGVLQFNDKLIIEKN